MTNSSGRAVTAPSCPHLGISDDPSAFYAYPSPDNCCYHSRRPATPLLAHQEAFCLGGREKDCPVYWQPRKKAFPASLEATEAALPKRSGPSALALAIVIGVMAFGYAAFRFGPQVFRLQGRVSSPVPVAPMMAPSVTPLPTTTTNPVSTPTLIPTGTALPPEGPHTLEVPFEIDGHQLLLHRIGAGDMFDTIDAEYETTPAVVRALNYSLRDSLLANTVLVIAPGLQTVDSALPSFKVRQVDVPEISIDELSLQYHVEAAVFRHYNRCTDACSFSAGDWVLIPVILDSTATP